MIRTRTRWLVALAPALLGAPLAAQTIPSPRDVLGYDLGADFTSYAGVARYARALADASPYVDLRVYGRTPEGRELLHLVIARPDYLARLDDILARLAELARPDTPPERARQIAATTPALVVFTYGIHGNESSSTEAALWTAYDLARGAPGTEGLLDSLVVILDPVANPDGRERYVQWFRSVVGPRRIRSLGRGSTANRGPGVATTISSSTSTATGPGGRNRRRGLAWPLGRG